MLALHDGGLRSFRVSRIHDLAPAPGESQRPAGFDVAAAWERARAAFEQGAEPLAVTVRLRDASVSRVRTLMRARLDARCEDLDRPGWTAMRLRFPGADAAAAMLAGFAGEVEVVSPEAVRDRLRDIGRGLTGLYGEGR